MRDAIFLSGRNFRKTFNPSDRLKNRVIPKALISSKLSQDSPFNHAFEIPGLGSINISNYGAKLRISMGGMYKQGK